jgi:hypothetical protein
MMSNAFDIPHGFKSDRDFIHANLFHIARPELIHKLPDLLARAKELNVELPDLSGPEGLSDEAKCEFLRDKWVRIRTEIGSTV